MIILSALVAHTGWHWMLERWDRLSQFRFEWPALTAAMMAIAVRWLMAAVILAGLVWLVSVLLARRAAGVLSKANRRERADKPRVQVN